VTKTAVDVVAMAVAGRGVAGAERSHRRSLPAAAR
jgi:hypothetical protein